MWNEFLTFETPIKNTQWFEGQKITVIAHIINKKIIMKEGSDVYDVEIETFCFSEDYILSKTFTTLSKFFLHKIIIISCNMLPDAVLFT